MALVRRFTRSCNLIAISAIAVLIPTAILFSLQYRSLQQLRAKTRLVAQDQVRQSLDLLQTRLEEKVAAIAAESLARIDGDDLAAANLGSTGVKFQAILEKYPVKSANNKSDLVAMISSGFAVTLRDVTGLVSPALLTM